MEAIIIISSITTLYLLISFLERYQRKQREELYYRLDLNTKTLFRFEKVSNCSAYYYVFFFNPIHNEWWKLPRTIHEYYWKFPKENECLSDDNIVRLQRYSKDFGLWSLLKKGSYGRMNEEDFYVVHHTRIKEFSEQYDALKTIQDFFYHNNLSKNLVTQHFDQKRRNPDFIKLELINQKLPQVINVNHHTL